MVPSGPPTPIGGSQSILRSSSQPRTQFNSNSILNHFFQNEPTAFHQNPHHQIDPIQNFHQQMRAQVKLEPSDQQLHSLRCMRNSDSSVFLQQPALQRMLQQQRGQLLQQQQQIHPQGKLVVYEPGTCARKLMHYMYHQQHRPDDNNIDFWRKLVAEYFAPNAKKRWCVSLYGSGRQTTGVFPQDVWQCEICNRKPGRGFETTVEVLPRLCQIKYASGTLEEFLYVDMPREYQNASGQIVLDYAKAVQESVFEQLRVVRDGQLRIVYNSDLKIASWEFCARRHEELIPRRLMIPQVSYLGAVVHKYQAAAQNALSSGLSSQDLQTTCSSFVASARQLAKALEVPQVNDLGYSKRYIRCLQISEVVNSMKDLIDYSRETGSGPMDSLINFPRRTSSSSGLQHQQSQQPEEHQPVPQNPNHNYQASLRTTSMQLADISNGISSVNNSVNGPSPSTTSAVTVASLLLQNSTNSSQENQVGTANSPYNGGSIAQIPSASSSSALPPSQTNLSSPFPSPTPSSSANNLTQHGATQSHEAELGEPQNSVQQILQEMVMSKQINGLGTLGNEMKGINGIRGMGIGGIRAAMSNNINGMNMNGRMEMNQMSQDLTVLSYQQQQEMGNRLLDGIGAVNNFNGLQFDWKTSP